MSSSSLNPGHASPVSWGVALAATSLLLIGGGAIIWTHPGQSASGPTVPPAGDGPEFRAVGLKLPPRAVPTPQESPFALHTVSFSMENGTRVVKIRVVPDGDELIVDAATGR